MALQASGGISNRLIFKMLFFSNRVFKYLNKFAIKKKMNRIGGKMKKSAFFVSVVALFLVSCSQGVVHRLKYDFTLTEVERPTEAVSLLGEHEISTTAEEGYTYRFEDGMIKILWLPSVDMLEFFLINKTDSPIKIIWNEAVYISEKGDSHQIIHAGVKYSQRNRLKLPSTIEQKSTLKDYVYPSDYVSYADDAWVERPMFSGRWEGKPLLPNSQKGGDPQEFLQSAKNYVGKTIRVVLPLGIDEDTYNYTFVFEVSDVNLGEEK
jgi:hypothetical protein